MMKPTIRILALSLAAGALLLGSAHAAQNNGGGPTSTPTWTIGTKPHVAGEEVTIKEKSSTTKSGSESSAKQVPPKCSPNEFWDPVRKRCVLKPYKVEQPKNPTN